MPQRSLARRRHYQGMWEGLWEGLAKHSGPGDEYADANDGPQQHGPLVLVAEASPHGEPTLPAEVFSRGRRRLRRIPLFLRRGYGNNLHQAPT